MDRQTALRTAYDLLKSMHGLRKNRDYRTIQNDLNLLADALMDASDLGRKSAD